MATPWTKKTIGLPYKDSKTKDYHIVVQVTAAQAGGSVPGAFQHQAFHEQIALQTARDNLYEYYAVNLVGVAKGDSLPPASTEFEVVTINGVKQKSISPRPNGPALYLVRYKGGNPADLPKLPRQAVTGDGGFEASNPATDTTGSLIFDSYNDFAKMMELLAKKLEEYDKQLKEENPDGMNYSGPAALGYGTFDLLAEAESLRSFYKEIFDLFKRNNVSEKQPFQMGYTINLITDTTLLGQGFEKYLIQYIASSSESGKSFVFNGSEYFFGGFSRWKNEYSNEPNILPGREPFILPRTANFIKNLPSIINIMLSGYGAESIDDINVGVGCNLPPLAKEEDPMPLLLFVEDFVQPRPMLLFSLEGDPIKVFDTIAEQKEPVVNKQEKDSIEYGILANEVLAEAVANRTENIDEYIGDFVFDSLARSPGDIREIKTIDDLYAYVLNRMDLPTLTQEIMACLGLNLSIQDLIDIACDKLLKKVFSDPKTLDNLIEFLGSGDPLLGTALAEAGIDSGPLADAAGSINQLTNDLTNYLASKIDTGNPSMDEFFTETTLEAFDGDVAATKRFICQVLIVGPFVGLMALINLIKRLRFGRDDKPPKIPPFEKCETGFNLFDDIPILDRLKQFLIDMAYEMAEEMLEELILTPIRDLLESLVYCRQSDDDLDYGENSSDDFPYEDDAFKDWEGEGNLPEDFNINDFLNNLFSSLSPGELCALYKGEANSEALEYVLDYFKNMTPEGSSFAQIDTIKKVENFFKDLGKKTDLSRCDELPVADDPEVGDLEKKPQRPLIDLCSDDAGFKEKMLARALAQRGLTIEEVEEQLLQKNVENSEVAGALLDLLTAADRATEVKIDMSSAMKDSIKESTDKVVNGTFAAIERTFITEVAVLVPLMTSKKLNMATFLAEDMINSAAYAFHPGFFVDDPDDNTPSWYAYRMPVHRPQLLNLPDDAPLPSTAFTTSKAGLNKEVRFRILSTGKSNILSGGTALVKNSMEIYDVGSGTVDPDFGTIVFEDSVSDIPTSMLNFLNTPSEGTSLVGNRPTEPQVFELLIDSAVRTGLGGPGKYFKYRDDLLGILLPDPPTAALYGVAFRGVVQDIANKIMHQVEEATEDNAFKELNFLKENVDLYDLTEIKDKVSEDFSEEMSKTKFTDPSAAPTLFEYIVNWPTAGGARALIKLFCVETTLKSILSIALTKPDQLLDSKLFSKYLEKAIRKKILIHTYANPGWSTGVLSWADSGGGEIQSMINQFVKDVSESISDIMEDKLIYYRLTDDLVTRPRVVDYPTISELCRKRQAKMSDGETHNSYDMINGVIIDSGKGNHWRDLKSTQFTNPRFFEFDQQDDVAGTVEGGFLGARTYTMHTSGFVMEKCVRYKLHSKTHMRTLYLSSKASTDDSLWQALANEIEYVSMELVGKGTTIDEILGPDRPTMELSYSDFNLRWNSELFNSYPEYQTSLTDFFETIEIGYRLSYVFPEDLDGYWWQTPLSGQPTRIWDRFKELNMHLPTLLAEDKYSLEPFMDMKIEKAFFMREVPRYQTFNPSIGMPLVANSFQFWPKVFVLPFTTVTVPLPNKNNMEEISRHFGAWSGSTAARNKQGWEALREDPVCKTLFKLIFPMDKILSLIAIRNALAFEEAIISIDEACLGNGLFALTEEAIMSLIDKAEESKNVSNLHELSKGTIDNEGYKSLIKKQVGLGEKDCRSKFDLIGTYGDPKA